MRDRDKRNHALRHAPKDRNILVKNKQWSFVDYGQPYRLSGYAWTEVWWNKNDWYVWCGNKQTSTTEHVDAVDWCELPDYCKENIDQTT